MLAQVRECCLLALCQACTQLQLSPAWHGSMQVTRKLRGLVFLNTLTIQRLMQSGRTAPANIFAYNS